MRAGRWLGVGIAGAVAVGSCTTSPRERDGYVVESDAGVPSDASIRLDADPGPPSLDEAGYCGNQLISSRLERRNLYFVVDRSGSMLATLEGSGLNRFDGMREAIASVLSEVGHRVHFGAAVFPGIPARDSCATGTEVFPTRPGDPAIYAATDTYGPVLTSFLSGLASIGPTGGTPLSPTMVHLTPTLQELPGETFVVLATDGSPNCNDEAECDGFDCAINYSQVVLEDGTNCSGSINCCDPRYTSAGAGPIHCLDGPASVDAVAALAADGIKTYVIGLPDAADYAALLNEMAVAGNTGHTRYFAAADATDLATHLRAIGAEVAIDCDIDLDETPPDPALVNVYLDAVVLPSDEERGWYFTTPDSIRVVGEPCSQLESGDVLNVQVVAGCPTEIY